MNADLKELEEALKIPDKIKAMSKDDAIDFLKKIKPSLLRSLLIGESSLDPREVDSIMDEDLSQCVLQEFYQD